MLSKRFFSIHIPHPSINLPFRRHEPGTASQKPMHQDILTFSSSFGLIASIFISGGDMQLII